MNFFTIQLLERPIPPPPLSSSVSQNIQMAISRERNELPENRWCQNDRIFEGFSDFQKKKKWISVFLYFFREIRWSQNDRNFGGFSDFQNKKSLMEWQSDYHYSM